MEEVKKFYWVQCKKCKIITKHYQNKFKKGKGIKIKCSKCGKIINKYFTSSKLEKKSKFYSKHIKKISK